MQPRCTENNDPYGFKKKRKHSPRLFSFTTEKLQLSRKKRAPATDSPRSLSGSCDSIMSSSFHSSSANKFFTSTSSRKVLEEINSFGNCSTPSVQIYPSQDNLGRNSKENFPSPFLSPESLELPKETMSSPESVCERMALNRGLIDEDDDVQSVAQSKISSTKDLFSQEGSIHLPTSPFNKNDRDYYSNFSQVWYILFFSFLKKSFKIFILFS